MQRWRVSQISFRNLGRGFSSLGTQNPSRIRTEWCFAVLGAHGRSLSALRNSYGKVTARIHKSDHDFDDAFEAHGGDCLPEHFKVGPIAGRPTDLAYRVAGCGR
jgi:hypothetical protein